MYTFLEVVEMLKQRYQMKNLTVSPFNPEMNPLSLGVEISEDERILLLDENGTRITTLIYGETVSDALKLLGEEAKEVAYVLSLDAETIASLFHSS